MKRYTKSLSDAQERFWEKVDKTPGHGQNGDCWQWTGATNKGGYGHLRINKKDLLSHRYSFELAHKGISGALLVLHSCDNPACVNPAHLSQGTQKENVSDMVSKKRQHYQKRTHCKRGHDLSKQAPCKQGYIRCDECIKANRVAR